MRVSAEEEIEGLDIGEHGMQRLSRLSTAGAAWLPDGADLGRASQPARSSAP